MTLLSMHNLEDKMVADSFELSNLTSLGYAKKVPLSRALNIAHKPQLLALGVI